MAVSGTRRGPGWWMDRDGGWNPPELWPETTPPLPGWVRNENGRWEAPMEVVEDPDGKRVIDLTASKPSSPAAVRTPKISPVPLKHVVVPEETGAPKQPSAETPNLSLGFAPAEVAAQPANAIAAPAKRRWWLIVAVIAVVIALLLVVLLVL